MNERVSKPSCKVQVVLSERGYDMLRKLAFGRNMTQGRYIEWMMGQTEPRGTDGAIDKWNDSLLNLT